MSLTFCETYAVDIRRDPRFSLEKNWNDIVAPHLSDDVIATTVFGCDGKIEGWQLFNKEGNAIGLNNSICQHKEYKNCLATK